MTALVLPLLALFVLGVGAFSLFETSRLNEGDGPRQTKASERYRQRRSPRP